MSNLRRIPPPFLRRIFVLFEEFFFVDEHHHKSTTASFLHHLHRIQSFQHYLILAVSSPLKPSKMNRLFDKWRPKVSAHQWRHSHNFLGDSHHKNERKTFWVILLCVLSMVLEISFGLVFGSLAVLSDGIHMGTHVTAFVITWLAYSFSRRYSEDSRFVFGTGKVGDLAAFTSAIILFMIALIIFYDGVRYVHSCFQTLLSLSI